MSKRRRVSELVYHNNRKLKYPAKIVVVDAGTGTCALKGVYTLVATTGASHAATRCYLTQLVANSAGTLVGTA